MSEAPASEKILLKPAEAARLLSFSPRLVTLTHRGDIPAVRLGRLVLYRPQDLAAAVDRLAAQPYQKQERPNRRAAEGNTDG